MPFHAGQSFAARTAQQAQKEKLHLIVRVMRERDAGNFLLARDVREKFVAQFPRGHFHGNFSPSGKLFHVRTTGMEWQPQLLGGGRRQFFIRIAGAAAQPVVEVCDGNLPAVFSDQRILIVPMSWSMKPSRSKSLFISWDNRW